MNGSRDKPTNPNTLTIVGVWNSNLHILLYPSLSCLYVLRCTFHYQSPTKGRQLKVLHFCGHMNGRRDKPTIPSIVVVCNSNLHILLYPSLSRLYEITFVARSPTKESTILHFCRHMNGSRDKPIIHNTLTRVGVWNSSISLLLSLSFLELAVLLLIP